MPSDRGNNMQTPETADDVLAAGVEFEEAGEKWRAGDANKSCRFFAKALDTYERGILKHADSFDLAYNRGRLQFDLAQQPRLLRFLPFSEQELLSKALDSHQFALQIKPQNADTLFNIAQILTSLAEHAIQTSDTTTQSAIARGLLQNAADSFDQCLHIQMRHYRDSQEAMIAVASFKDQSDEPPIIPANVAAANASTSEGYSTTERWASIEEPITESTLRDTCLAAVQSLTIMIPLLQSDPNELECIEQTRNKLMSQAEAYLDRSDTVAVIEFRLTGITSLAALLNVSFAFGRLEIDIYSRQLDALLEVPELENSVELLIKSAETRIALGVACMRRSYVSAAEFNDFPQITQLCWRQYSTASNHLNSATNLSAPSTPWRIYALKADVELLRARLAEFDYTPARTNLETLLKNAEVFYRGAKNIAAANDNVEAVEDLFGRELLISALRGETELTSSMEETMGDMQEQGLLKESSRISAIEHS